MGVRTDVEGNVWASKQRGPRRRLRGGVNVWNPDGKLIGRIRLPEVCGNIYVSTQGAARRPGRLPGRRARGG